MTRIAILTPALDDPSYGGRWRAVFDRLATPLVAEGFEVTPAPWPDHADDASGLTEFDLVLPLVVWGYHRDQARWTKACETWARADLPLHNPADVLNWNTDKRYLGRLAEAGAAIVPTLYRENLRPADLDDAFAAFGCETLVVKPVVSGGSWKTLRLRPGDPLDGAPDGVAMIQPYMAGLEREGELSLLFFGGRFSHAIRKVPAPGDFRSQPDYGGAVTAITPPADAMRAAEKVLTIIGGDILYARIDLVPGPDGEPLLIEAELIEPDFYLAFDPERGAGFARAVRARFGG